MKLYRVSSVSVLLILTGELFYYLGSKVLANNLSGHLYGDVFSCISAIEILGIIMVFGMDVVILKYNSYFKKVHPAKGSSIVAQVINLFLKIHPVVLLLTVVLMILMMVVYIDIAHRNPFLLVLVLFPVFSWYALYRAITRSIGRTVFTASMETVQRFSFFIIAWLTVLLLTEVGVTDLHAVLIMVLFLSFSYLLSTLCAKLIVRFKAVYDERLHINITHYIPSYTFQRMGYYTFNYIPILIFEVFGKHEGELGVLAAFITIASLSFVPLKAISITIAPFVSQALHEDAHSLRKKLAQVRVLTISATLLTLVVLFVFAEYILASLNKDFLPFTHYLYLWLVGPFVYGVTCGTNKVIQMSVKGKLYGNIVWSTILVSQIIGSSIGSYYYSLKGAIYANLMANAIYLAMMLVFAHFSIKEQIKHLEEH